MSNSFGTLDDQWEWIAWKHFHLLAADVFHNDKATVDPYFFLSVYPLIRKEEKIFLKLFYFLFGLFFQANFLHLFITFFPGQDKAILCYSDLIKYFFSTRKCLSSSIWVESRSLEFGISKKQFIGFLFDREGDLQKILFIQDLFVALGANY